MKDETKLKLLPELPYKGLSFYTAADAPLFAGRDEAVEECGGLMLQDTTRVLLLHGSTGCGKSSFLQAGLIPYLEKKRLQFDREGAEALFVTSTWEPLRQLANFVFNIATADRPVETDQGPESLNLTEILLNPETKKAYTQEEFINKHGEKAEQILELLYNLSTHLRRTFIVVIDQAEEVLTLRPGTNGDAERDEFFRFVNLFPGRSLPIKLLIALRTEYFGRFVARSRASFDEFRDNRDYYLSDLTLAQLTEAILKPTSTTPIRGYASTPFEKYAFVYEAARGEPAKGDEREEDRSVAGQIAFDLKKKFSAGGALPVMQIVCASLYESAKKKSVIQKSDYRAGRLEGQIASYLDKTLYDMCERKEIPENERYREVRKWKDVLASLASAGPDGTVTTKVLRLDALEKTRARVNCRIPFKDAAEFLRASDRRLLRDRSVYSDDGSPIQCFSLGHDAIGLVLLRWLELRKEEDRKREQERKKRLEFEADVKRRNEDVEAARRGILYAFRVAYGGTGLLSCIAAFATYLVTHNRIISASALLAGLSFIGVAASVNSGQIDLLTKQFFRLLPESFWTQLGSLRVRRWFRGDSK